MSTDIARPNRVAIIGASGTDHGDFCLYCVASSEWDGLAPHVSSGPPTRAGAKQREGKSHVAEA